MCSVDTDGLVTDMIPWLLNSGIEGVYPLERQAGVDLCELRREYPSLLMMGGFDKMTMSRGEDAMRREFERLLPGDALGRICAVGGSSDAAGGILG